MRLSVGPRTRVAVQGAMRLARLLELPERDAEDRLRELERDPLFARFRGLGVIAFDRDRAARFAAKRLGARGLRTDTEGLGAVLDGKGDLALLIERVGQERFTECFLSDEALDDAARARRCGVSVDEARRLRALVDGLYVQAEFQSPAAAPAAQVCSAVAGIGVEKGRSFLAFFHRDLWKGRYRVDEERRAALAVSLPPGQARRLQALLVELEQLERRKSTLLKVLEAVVDRQRDFLVKRDPALRRPFTQRELASVVGSEPSVINRLISNKSVELPWGLEAPLKAFVPSAKTLLKDRLHDLIAAIPDATDEALRRELERRHGARLSRRSVAQYRKELGSTGP